MKSSPARLCTKAIHRKSSAPLQHASVSRADGRRDRRDSDAKLGAKSGTREARIDADNSSQRILEGRTLAFVKGTCPVCRQICTLISYPRESVKHHRQR